MTGDTPREPDARDPTIGRGEDVAGGVEDIQADPAAGRSGEEGAQPEADAAAGDVEGSALGGTD